MGKAAETLGRSGLGGEQRGFVRQALTRLRSCTIESAVRTPDGHEEVLIWGFIDKAYTTTRGGGQGWVILSTDLVQLLADGSVTWLHAPTWDAIADQDRYAARLWSFLETERLGDGWRYSLFRDSDSETRNLPAIADLLRIDWRSRKKVALRLREACKVICAEDTRYRLKIVAGAAAGSWRLEAYRGAHRSTAPPPKPDALPTGVVGAWRRAHAGRLPSKKQEGVLREVVGRRGPEWVTAQLCIGGQDPFRALLEADVALRQEAEVAAIRRERDHAAEKAQHRRDAEALFGQALGRDEEPESMASLTARLAATAKLES